MNYREFGKRRVRVSMLGFGAMRLPTRGSEHQVDEAAAIEMIRWAIDHGVNYVDTAYVYHGGQGETVVGKALAGGYREKVFLATKLPIWQVQQRADCERILQEQLARLQTDRIDFYLLHCLQAPSWTKMRAVGVPAWAAQAQRSGRIGEFGFSFHDSYEAFVEIVDDYAWDFCQIQYNYVNEEVQAGTRGLQYATAHGLDVVIMEPLFGGTLAVPPPAVRAIWDEGPGAYDPVATAFRWLWDKPEVTLVLSGMSTRAQVEQNVATANGADRGCLSAEEARLIARVQAKYRELSPIPCTRCGYCLPCPQGVAIPANFDLYNQAVVFAGSSARLCRNLYALLPASERAAACTACGQCEERCPQQLPIREMLGRVQQQLG